MRQDDPSRPTLSQSSRMMRWLEYGEDFIQGAVGALLLLGALVALGYTVYHFIAQLRTPSVIIGPSGQTIHLSTPQNLAEAIVNLLSDLLLPAWEAWRARDLETSPRQHYRQYPAPRSRPR